MEPMAFGVPGGTPPDVVVRPKEETAQDYNNRMARAAELERKAERQKRRVARRVWLRGAAREVSSTGLEVAGILIVAYGLFTKWPWLGVVVAGLGVIIVGMAISPPTRRAPHRNARQLEAEKIEAGKPKR